MRGGRLGRNGPNSDWPIRVSFFFFFISIKTIIKYIFKYFQKS
jgi:hypothetical protein